MPSEFEIFESAIHVVHGLTISPHIPEQNTRTHISSTLGFAYVFEKRLHFKRGSNERKHTTLHQSSRTFYTFTKNQHDFA